MKGQKITAGSKILFLLHGIVAGLVGVQHLVAPRVWTNLAGMDIAETVTWRLIGAALVSFAVSSWLAYRETDWERVRIIVIMEIVWSVLGAMVILWGILFEGLAPLEWLNVILLIGFAMAFSILFSKSRST